MVPSEDVTAGVENIRVSDKEENKEVDVALHPKVRNLAMKITQGNLQTITKNT